MPSHAKRRARAQAVAEEDDVAGEDGSSSDSEDPDEAAAAPQRPAKRLKASAARGAQPPGADEPAVQPGGAGGSGTPGWRNKEKPLVLCSRGIPSRHRHLMLDLVALLPHCKKDVKLDTKDEREVINEVAELHGCSSALFFECRKHQDLYLWLAKTPGGPSVKFHVTNVHTMAELSLPGNHLKGSRPVLRFDASFGDAPHGPLLRELLTQVFVTPKGHRKSKPFLDHVLLFGFCDGRVWFRNYAAHFPAGKTSGGGGGDPHGGATLVEVGPRMTLNPIRVFAGSFRGAVLWSNPDYVSPNAVRRHQKQVQGGTYARKVAKKQKRKAHQAEWAPQPGEWDNERVFK